MRPMNSRRIVAGLAAGGLAVMGSMLGGVAVAQETVTTTDSVTVEAPRVFRQEIGRTSSGIPIEEISLSNRVAFSDLDLRNPGDVEELQRRVNVAAWQGCRELDWRYPDSFYPPVGGRSDCVRDAVASAMDQVNAAVTAAQ